MISLYIKTTKRTDLMKSFKRFLADNYDSEDISFITKQIQKTQTLRDEMVSDLQAQSKTNQLLDSHKKYFAQFELLSKALSFDKNKSGPEFTWNDSFREEKRASSRNANFEKNCVLFNMAVLQAKLALSQNRQKSDGIREATKNFLYSASIYAHLIETTKDVTVQEKTMDMSQSSLKTAALFMQAQAQTCFFEKAQRDKFSIELISKLAMSVAEIYEHANRVIEKDSAFKNWLKKGDYPFHRHIASQMEIFYSTCYFWTSKSALHEKKYGEELTWLKASLEHSEKAEKCKLKSLHENIEKTVEQFKVLVEKEYERSLNDNNSIYHYRVPELDELSKPVAKLFAVVKKVDLSELRVDNEAEILNKLIPVAVAKVTRRVRKELLENLQRLVQSNNIENSKHSIVLREFAAFIPTQNGRTDTRIDKFRHLFVDIEGIRRLGGNAQLKNSLKEIKNSHEECKRIYTIIITSLQEETRQDEVLRERYNQYWNRPASDKLVSSYYREADVIKNFLSDAEKSNEKMQSRLEKLSPSLEYLETQPSDKIVTTLPCVHKQFEDCEVVKRIQEIVSLMNDLVTQKNALYENGQQEINKQSLSTTVLTQLGNKKLSEEVVLQIIERLQEDHLGKLKDEADKFEVRLKEQHEPLSRLGAELERQMQNDKVFIEKQSLLKKYEAAVKGFDDLSESVKAGQSFYKDLKSLYLDVLFAKVNDFVTARRQESERLQGELERFLRNGSGGYFGDNVESLDGNFNQMNLNDEPNGQSNAYYHQQGRR